MVPCPGGASPPLKPMCWAPSTGLTPNAAPFCQPKPVPSTLQPVMAVEPLGKLCPEPGANAGDSKLPFVNGPIGEGGHLPALPALKIDPISAAESARS